MIILRNKEFARRDYAGLTPENAAKLREQRSRIAKELKQNMQFNQAAFGPMTSNPGDPTKLKISNLRDRFAAQDQAKEARNLLLNSQPKPEKLTNKAGLGGSSLKTNKAGSSITNLIKKANLKKAGKVGLCVAGAAGLGYGIKKAVE